MASLRVFVSSTCYDLSVIRSQLRQFIERLGHEPVMSDYNDVVYDPASHTHTSCIDEVAGVDAVVVIIGSRFGGTVVPQALQAVDIESLKSVSKSHELLKTKEALSITQLEVLKAIERSVPVFAFVDQRVWHDHATYEKNKGKEIADQIEYDSIDKPSTAKYVFEFINFLRHRNSNNAITTFSRLQDIEDSLRRQWSGLLQHLLLERRTRALDRRRIEDLGEQFENLKAAILAAVGSKDEKQIARGVVRYRKLYDFVSAFGSAGAASILSNSAMSWAEFLESEKIVDVTEVPGDFPENYTGRTVTQILHKSDGTFYMLFRPFDMESMQREWDSFMEIREESRAVIVDALGEMRGGSSIMMRRFVRHINQSLESFLAGSRIKGASDRTTEDHPE
ncbi:DUF4062 domain-containing protein [Burkholderia gladioli]|uniref:DUF4062 domain-containing protein n=1 Tax=Burkholderia gladioli TaxID=28095 RepID=UPI001640D46D|nr:DUF4062 domain-containing protein [Burkholderia gladioli]